jgi:OmpA-OmpF porin, OOP family
LIATNTALCNYEAAVKKLGGTRKEDAKSTPIYLHLNKTVGNDGYRLAVIEPTVMEQTVTAGELGKELKANGLITLYINFATAQSELPDDAKPIIRERAKLLELDPKLKLSVEGHTDNVGNVKDNQSLSDKRSQNIVAALVTAGANKARLQAVGKGQSMPIAGNRNEQGRAKNRRVELVEVKS